MQKTLKELKLRLSEIKDLEAAAAVLGWDLATYMPPGGAPARGRQIALLSRLGHERLTDPEIGRLLEKLEPESDKLPYDDDDAALIRVARRDFEKAVKVPPEFVAEFNAHSAAAYQVWTTARPANDFQAVEANLEKTLEYSRRLAEFFPGYDHIADPLIDFADQGTTVETLRPLFSELRTALVPLVQSISEQAPVDDSCLKAHFPESEQRAFGKRIIERFGYDFERGREDKTHHPFMTSFSIGDVRITTRVKENDLTEALFSTLHEAGHGMYEQGINPEYEGLPIADGASSGVHESQSRLWENFVGRSRGFWTFFYPQLQEVFSEQLSEISLDTFYRAINKVERSLIRTDADEVTYNLHVMLRFDFELDLLEGRLAVKDLPAAWNARYKEDLGVEPPDDKDGVLQDVHWYAGVIGGSFQGYTLGNVLCGQFFEAALQAHPEIPDEIAKGTYETLHGWMKENIYHHGRKFTPAELVERATGIAINVEPYLRYLQTKFSDLYTL
ncbi:MAG: carboxypeptidase M32 [Anaerolineales bacterium]|nr:carboxypeptidase M32 [Anaerolineales bacterium]